jgi:hypothetical protein
MVVEAVAQEASVLERVFQLPLEQITQLQLVVAVQLEVELDQMVLILQS